MQLYAFCKRRRVPAISLLFLTTLFFQQARAQISLSGNNVPLERIFREIRKQSGYDFLYNDRLLANSIPVNINVSDASLDQALKLSFKDQPPGL